MNQLLIPNRKEAFKFNISKHSIIPAYRVKASYNKNRKRLASHHLNGIKDSSTNLNQARISRLPFRVNIS